MTIRLAGRLLDDVGSGINGATVKAIPNGSSTPVATTTTQNDSQGQAGYWSFTNLADGLYKIRVEYQGKVRELFGPSEVQFNRLYVGARYFVVEEDGDVTLWYATVPGDGEAINSPLLRLKGAYDSNPSPGSVTVSTRAMGLRTVLATDGTYKLSIRNDDDEEKAYITHTGEIVGANVKVGTESVLASVTSDTNVTGNKSDNQLVLGWSGQLAPSRGGTGLGTYTLGDLLYASSSSALAKLPGNTTTTRKFLRQVGTGSGSAAPAWDTILGSDVTSAVAQASNADTVDGAHVGNGSWQVPLSNGTVNTNLNADMVDGAHAGTGANNVLKLDSSGYVPLGNLSSYACRLTNSTAISIPNATAYVLDFNTERSDPQNMHSPGSELVVVPVAGWYLVGGSVSFATDNDGIRHLSIRYNQGNEIVGSRVSAAQGANTELNVATVWYANANDKFELLVYHTAGNALNIEKLNNRSPEFYVIRVA